MTQEAASETHVLVLTDSVESAQLLLGLLRGAEGLVVHTSPADDGEALTAVARYQPQVVVITDTLEHLPTMVAVLDATSPEVLQVVILPEGDADGAIACSLAGARATLMKPFERQRLLGAIQIVHSRDLRLRQQLGADENAGTAAGRQNRPRVVAVHGAKGGVGTTTIACNLAAALCDLTGRRVALIDGDLLSSDVGVLCNLPPTRSLADLLPEVHRLDAEVLEGAFLQHPSGVGVLLAPDDLQRAEEITPDEVKRAVNALRQHFDFQIVDTPSDPVPVTLAVMDEADLIVLVLTPDMASLRSAARFLRLAAQLDYADEKIMVVVNRADAGRQIDLGVVEAQLHRSVAVALPMDGKVAVDCTNAGDLFAVAFPRSRIAQQVFTLAEAVAERFGWPVAAAARGAPPGKASPAAAAGAPDGPAPVSPMSIVHRLTRWLTPRKREVTGSAR